MESGIILATFLITIIVIRQVNGTQSIFVTGNHTLFKVYSLFYRKKLHSVIIFYFSFVSCRLTPPEWVLLLITVTYGTMGFQLTLAYHHLCDTWIM